MLASYVRPREVLQDPIGTAERDPGAVPPLPAIRPVRRHRVRLTRATSASYYLKMASVIGKRVNGKTYYYLVTSARVDGEPRIVSQRYLGSAEDIDAATRGATVTPQRTRHLAFGDVAAVWTTLRRLRLPELVDDVVGARRAAVSVGTYLALAVLHHATASKPKQGLAHWWTTTAADRIVRPALPPAALAPHRPGRALDRLTEEHIGSIGEAVFAAVTREFDLGPGVLALDVPNLAAFPVPDGAETHRDLALAGVGLVVSRRGAVPLLSRVYQRGRPGSVPFGALIARLAARHRELAGADPTIGPITTVFDIGQHSQLDIADPAGPHFVGSLPLDEHPELRARSASALHPLDARRFPGVSVLDTRADVYGTSRRVVVIRSATLRAAQSRAFAQALGDATRRLAGLAAALAAGTFHRSRESVLTELARITRFRFNDRVLSTELTAPRSGNPRLTWRVDDAAIRRLEDEVFGKQLLVTDHDDWPVADVVTAYRARYHLESTFRVFHDPHVERWTPRRFAVHAMIRVLATTVTHLMRHEAQQAGIDLSVRELLDQLAGIEETRLTYPSTGGRPRVRRVLTELDPARQRLFDLYGLAELAPRE